MCFLALRFFYQDPGLSLESLFDTTRASAQLILRVPPAQEAPCILESRQNQDLHVIL